jgi:ribosomal protein S18 acetylase RimI-like enzyme
MTMDAIRRATPHDAAQIAHVHIESWRSAYKGIVSNDYLASMDETARTANWQEWLGSSVPIFVSTENAIVVGFISGGPIRDPIDDYEAELYTIYLLQHAQRRGIGTALLKELAHRLHEDGFRNMAAWVLEDNASSNFYEKSGAHRVASKQIEIGGAMLPVVAYGWPSLRTILSLE